jgi:hypothetical protein
MPDAMAMLDTMIAAEQQGIMMLRQLRELAGENPMRYEIESRLAEEQTHLDKLWQFKPAGLPAKVAFAMEMLRHKRSNEFLIAEQGQALAQAQNENAFLADQLAQTRDQLLAASDQAQQAGASVEEAQAQAQQAVMQADAAQQEALAGQTAAAEHANAKLRLAQRIQQMRQALADLAAQDPVAEEGVGVDPTMTSTQMDAAAQAQAQDPNAQPGADPAQQAPAQHSPALAIQAGRQGAPVVGNAKVLEELSRSSFGKLSRKGMSSQKPYLTPANKIAGDTRADLPAVPTLGGFTKKLRPGDIVVMTPQPDRPGAGVLERTVSKAFGAVSHALQGKYTHSGIYVGGGNVIDIRAETGVRKVPLRELTKNLSVAAVRPSVSARAREAAVGKAHEYLKNKDSIKYDIKGLVPAVASSFVKLKPRPIDEQNVICSSMVANMYSKDPIAGEARHGVKPVDFLRSDKVRGVGAFDSPVHTKEAGVPPLVTRGLIGAVPGAAIGGSLGYVAAPEDHRVAGTLAGAALGGLTSGGLVSGIEPGDIALAMRAQAQGSRPLNWDHAANAAGAVEDASDAAMRAMRNHARKSEAHQLARKAQEARAEEMKAEVAAGLARLRARHQKAPAQSTRMDLATIDEHLASKQHNWEL